MWPEKNKNHEKISLKKDEKIGSGLRKIFLRRSRIVLIVKIFIFSNCKNILEFKFHILRLLHIYKNKTHEIKILCALLENLHNTYLTMYNRFMCASFICLFTECRYIYDWIVILRRMECRYFFLYHLWLPFIHPCKSHHSCIVTFKMKRITRIKLYFYIK